MSRRGCVGSNYPSTGKKVLLWSIFVLTGIAAAWGIWLLLRFWFWREPTIDHLDFWSFWISYLLCMIGISVGYHRMHTHRAFKAGPVVQGFFLILGSMSGQMDPNRWASTHYKHHQVTDKPGDPHSPHVEDIPFAHQLWLVYPREKIAVHPRFGNNPVAVWVSRYFLGWVLLGLFIPFGIGYAMGGLESAWSAFFWGGPVRMFWQLQVTWAVNSFGHSWGYRPFDTLDESRNNPLVLVGTPEGNHNTHHAIPEGANQALYWWEWPFDYSAWAIIWPMQQLGLIREVKWITPQMVQDAHASLRRRRRDAQPSSS